MDAAAAMGCGLRRLAVLLMMCALTGHAAEYAVTVAGLGGLPEYEKEFTRLAHELEIELRANGDDTHVTTLTGAAATRVGLQQTWAQIARQMTPEDTFSLYLIGHGTFDGETYKFNIPGPDVTAQEIKMGLDALPARRQFVALMTSASGAAYPVLTGKGRLVITATKSGNEKNACVFARYWVEGLRDPAADMDKNGTVSVQEAYAYTQRKVKGYYDGEKLLATEHSMMSTPSMFTPAMLAVVHKGPLTPAAQGPLALRARDLETQVEKLKEGKTAMKPEIYRQQLTALLVELARTDLQVRP